MQGEEHGAGRDLPLRVQAADAARGQRDEAGDQALDRCESHNQLSQIFTFLTDFLILKVRYFKVRESTLHKLPDYIFMGLSIVHLMIYNSSEACYSDTRSSHSSRFISRPSDLEPQLSAARKVEAPGPVQQPVVRGADPGLAPQPGVGAPEPRPEQHLSSPGGGLRHPEQSDPAHPV